MTRKNFIAGAGTAAAVAMGVSAMAFADEPAASWQPESWAAEADIVIVGCGGAGICAAITAADEGLGDALVLEAAPEGLEGGNTRASAQVIFCPTSVEGAVEYQTNLNGGHRVDPELLQAWAENITQNIDWLTSQGIQSQETAFYNPEWPDMPGSENCCCYLASADGQMGFGALWDALAARAEELGVNARHDTRVTELVVNPATGEVCGVKDDAGNAYKARKGVLLACGGFENDSEMIGNFFQIGYYDCKPLGTPFNRGDGIRMAMSVGAELWHMNNFANAGYGYESAIGNELGTVVQAQWPHKDFIYVGPDGTRFMYEEKVGLARHGKYVTSGNATNMTQAADTWCVFGSDSFDDAENCVILQDYLCFWNCIHGLTTCHSNQEYLDAGLIVKGETAEELAEQMGVDPLFDRGTDVYNAFSMDAQGTASMQGQTSAQDACGNLSPAIRAFNLVPLKAPYYTVPIHTAILNTQGGPKRGADGSVLKPGAVAVPLLYAAGEMGTVYAYNYNGGGNVSEAMSSGRLAARSIGALQSWE